MAIIMNSAVNTWFGVRVDMIAILLMASIVFICILSRESVDTVLLSLMITYGLNIQFALFNTLKCFMAVEVLMVNAERCMNVVQIQKEISIQN